MLRKLTLISTLVLTASAASAGSPKIVEAWAQHVGMGWKISVTLLHDDTGWDHYADGWEVLLEDGTRLGYRELMHPHVNEQPFTRSLSDVMVPDGVRVVYVRPKCSIDGWAGDSVAVNINP